MLLPNLTTLALRTGLASLLSIAALAQHDECTQSAVLAFGVPVAFDTSTATPSAEAWPCGGTSGGGDLWFRYVAPSWDVISFSTCGSSSNLSLALYTGQSCGDKQFIVCNTGQACTLDPLLTGVLVPGASVFLRVGSVDGLPAVGAIEANLTTSCLFTTPPITNGFRDGAIFFDLEVSEEVALSGLQTVFLAQLGTPVGLEVYTTPDTHFGKELTPSAWVLRAEDNGSVFSGGPNSLTNVPLTAPIVLPHGRYGFALVAVDTNHVYAVGNASNQVHETPDQRLRLIAGSSQDVPFTTPLFTPRVWTGVLCYDTPTEVGTPYCSPSVPNSTGFRARIYATGSAEAIANDVTLQASALPPQSFGYFLVSRTAGLVAQPGGSQGILCLSGAIGRFIGPGQIMNSGSTGSFGLRLDLTRMPTPGGLVAAVAGETWRFQAWYRDSLGGIPTSNFTNGVVVNFQ